VRQKKNATSVDSIPMFLKTHNVSKKTETSSSYNQAFSVRTKSSTRKQEKCFLIQNKISAEKRNSNSEQNKFLKEIS